MLLPSLKIVIESSQIKSTSFLGITEMSSTASGSPITTYAKKLVQLGRPNLDIILDNHKDGEVYRTWDALSGRVEIKAVQDTRFDEVQITLEGSVSTSVESLTPTSMRQRITAVHKFLKLVMPMRGFVYPQPRIAKAGRTYSFPFNFVIPAQLLSTACTHNCAEHVQQAHLQLPPGMRDREVCGLDDLASDMSKVRYAINVKVIRRVKEDMTETVLQQGLRRLCIMPAVSEAPPLSIGDHEDYVLSKSKMLRKGMFAGKLGRITVSALQPGALMLPSPSNISSASTMATVRIQFDPHEVSSQPPHLGRLRTKINAWTWYSSKPAENLPSRNGILHGFGPSQRTYETSVPNSSRCVEAVPWTKETSRSEFMRRSSGASDSSTESLDNGNERDSSKAFYTVEVKVPISLPSSKACLPTFHSCIVSRFYSLELALTIHTPGTGIPASTISLCLPVQIAAAANLTSPAPLSPAELADADELLRPRIIEIPSPELVENSVLSPTPGLLPPRYEDFAVPSRQAVVEPGKS